MGKIPDFDRAPRDVERLKSKGRPSVVVISKEEAIAVLQRRSSDGITPQSPRLKPPDGSGEWIVKPPSNGGASWEETGLFEHKEFGRCATDPYLLALHPGEVSSAFPSLCRSKPQHALQGKVARHVWVPKPRFSGVGGADKSTVVTVVDDYEAIINDRNQVKEVSLTDRPTGYETSAQLARNLHLEGRDKGHQLGLVLIRFAEEKPDQAQMFRYWSKANNGPQPTTIYNESAFRAWLKGTGKTIGALAKEIRQSRPHGKRWGKKLARAALFLKFVLTTEAKRCTVRRLKRFLHDPRHDRVFTPLPDGVIHSEVKRLAAEVGIKDRALRTAAKELGVQHTNRGRPNCAWKLPAPSTAAAAGLSATTAQDTPLNGDRRHGPKTRGGRRGRKPNKDVAEVLEFCYEQHQKTARKLSKIRCDAEKKFADRGPKTDAEVTTNAKRHAARTGKTFVPRNSDKTL